jgi:hypothetical protein
MHRNIVVDILRLIFIRRMLLRIWVFVLAVMMDCGWARGDALEGLVEYESRIRKMAKVNKDNYELRPIIIRGEPQYFL